MMVTTSSQLQQMHSSQASGPVANAINSPCLIPPTNVCYEVANYVFNINLPPAPGGIQLHIKDVVGILL
jgi:hypothetical protein